MLFRANLLRQFLLLAGKLLQRAGKLNVLESADENDEIGQRYNKLDASFVQSLCGTLNCGGWSNVQSDLKIREKLPVHSGGPSSSSIQAHVLRVDGLVGKPLALTLSDLEKLPQQDLTQDFTCLEGWTVPEVKWRGVALNTLLSIAEPHPEARYVQASAGEFSIPLLLDSGVHVLLAICLGGTSVPPEHGGPVRLIVPGGDCFTNIKWLDHLELRREPGPNTAKTIALGRLP